MCSSAWVLLHSTRSRAPNFGCSSISGSLWQSFSVPTISLLGSFTRAPQTLARPTHSGAHRASNRLSLGRVSTRNCLTQWKPKGSLRLLAQDSAPAPDYVAMAWPQPGWTEGACIRAVPFLHYVNKVLLDLHRVTLDSAGRVVLHSPQGHPEGIRLRPWGPSHRTLLADIRRQLGNLVIKSCMSLFQVDSLISYVVRQEFAECYRRCHHNIRDQAFLFGPD